MIAELKNGMNVENCDVLIEKRSESLTKKGSAFLNLTLRDKTGSISAKLWDFNAETQGFIKEGSVINISGKVDEYNGNLQLILRDINESLTTPDYFEKRTQFDTETMWSELVNVVSSFEEPLTKFVAEEILLKQAAFIEAFKKAPAAKTVHNNWFGGLIEHVHALCALAEPIIRHYKRYQPKFSRDKVLFGLIMHDAGKVIEYDITNPVFPLTPVGILTNHIVLGPSWVYQACDRFADKTGNFKMERAQLMHILAAHHGTQTWGSPVSPSTLEALLVHHLDNLDSKMMHAWKLTDGKEGPIAGFSEQSYFEKVPFLKYN